MSYFIGGAPIISADITKSWGLSPASRNVVVPGDLSGRTGQDITLNLGGSIFHGIISDDRVETSFSGGTLTHFQLVDNRVKLQWDDVYCAFNMEDIREDDPSTPGIDRQKRYWHITPDNWDAQIKTWTAAPYNARQIIALILDADTLAYSWSAVYHSLQENPVHGIDANSGMKLGNLLQEITDHQGLVFTLTGANQLTWARKGEGSIPDFPSNASTAALGEALAPNDTNVRIVGDRNRYQDFPITLQVDWVAAYEPFVFEPAWAAAVDSAFGPFSDSMSGNAARAAKMRSVTVREYVDEVGSGYADYGMWGEVCRMEIPAWIYIQDIVFKAYRIPRDYTINGIDIDSIEMTEGLLAAVEHDLSSGIISYKSPREYYPESKAYVIAQGQQLDLIDPRTQTIITKEQLADARTKWVACNRFNLDIKNKSVIFESPVFVPGTDSSALIVFPNRGKSGIDSSNPLYNIAVPNANATFGHAGVRASLVWDAERYSKRYGSGVRKGPKYARGLNYHALMNGGAFSEEVKYADGKSADFKSNQLASSFVAQASTYASGEYKRPGGAGTELSPCIDRVSTHLSFQEGITETVALTKESGQSNFESERELERRAKSKDLFPGQSGLREDVKRLELISKITKGLKRNTPTDYSNLADVFQKPIGAVHSSPTGFNSDDSWLAGQPVYVDDTDTPTPTGKNFKGIVISDFSTGKGIAVATQGNVPVRIQGPFVSGDLIGIDDGAGQTAKKGGSKLLGTVNASYSGTDIVTAPIRLGVGSSEKADKKPFQLVDATEYDPESGAPSYKIRVRASTIFDGTSEELGFAAGDPDSDPFTFDVSGDGYVWGAVYIDKDTGLFDSPAREIDCGAPIPTNTDDEHYIQIGSYHVNETKKIVEVSNDRYGPITGEVYRLWWATGYPYYAFSVGEP